jgi:cystathionine beta-lyase
MGRSGEEIVLVPGVVTGLNLAFILFAEPGDAVLVQPPVYSHFIADPVNRGRAVISPALVKKGDTYEIDFDAFEEAITDRTRILSCVIPITLSDGSSEGTNWKRLADICLRRNILICSDEIHCDLLFPGNRHMPIATLGNEVADRTITSCRRARHSIWRA